MVLQEGLCSQQLIELLDEHIFGPNRDTCKAYAELHDINEIPDIPQRLRALMDWLDTFSDTKNVAGQGGQLLLNMLGKKQGDCHHKAMIFQTLCHRWGVPAVQVMNVSHRFVEISPDGGLTWRQYQLGGGGQCSSDVTEPGWGHYRRLEDSVLKPPVDRKRTRSGQPKVGSDLKTKIKDDLKKLVQQFSENQSASTEVMQQLKNNYSAFNSRPEDSGASEYDLSADWWILLSPQAFHQFGENIKDWENIIEKSASNMADYRRNATFVFIVEQFPQLFKLIQKKEIDLHYLNWLCDLYHTTPQFLKCALLTILQIFSGRFDSCQLRDRVKLMSMSYPLNPKKSLLDARKGDIEEIELSKRCENLVKTMAMSRSLLDQLSQPRIHQQLHHQPTGNSIIIPEKLMSGEAAFLNVSKSVSYKPIIFDCTSLSKQEVDNKITGKIKSVINSEIMEMSDNEDFGEIIKIMFFYWLAAHHMDDTTLPLWLMYRYENYGETAKPFKKSHFTESEERVNCKAQLRLPPERIKDHFNQPTAVVLQ